MRKFLLALAAMAAVSPAYAADGTFDQAMLTPEAALKAAQAAMDSCRKNGWQVAVSVVDRGGNVQALLRDRYAGPHTVGVATGKAWTAVSFRTNTTDLVALTGPGMAQAGLRTVPGATVLGGGLKIEAAGALIAGIGVSGAPGGESDDICAKAGLAAIQDLLNF
ncbi:GlcG/HbpS family heme-binding protein [Magnetospirillum sulfuroxidans]|uniref:Heme-binding protein n=1 Tax=Magnetospirillum sulfuroxidans TaxID=611300 RepID=A0ABS5IBQ7_9PROT|nr:heme-binding protein [Magnetospirillum sulfuroxidans]MBR9971857.1 heme-binding protein [Magnetospirillum sulfuroxidans]